MKTEEEAALNLAVVKSVQEGRKKLGPHPSDEQLLAFHRGDLSEEESDHVQELLAHYPKSVRRLADLTGLEGEPDDPDYLSDEDLEGDWALLQARLGSVAPSVAAQSDGEASRLTLARKVTFWRIAAGLACLAFIASLFYLSPRHPIAEPEVMARRVLLPDGKRGAPGEEGAIRLNLQADKSLLLVPSLLDQARFPSYRLEILRDGSDKVELLWSQAGVQLNDDDSFDLRIPDGYLLSGRHVFRLYGVEGETQSLLATYTIDL